MVNKTLLNKTLGTRKNPFHNLTKDTDGDKVMNVMDCEPFNPKKQGFIHDAKQKLAAFREERRKTREQNREDRFERKEKAREAAVEERKKQAIETAKFREQERGRRRRESIKQGGSMFSFLSSGASTSERVVKKTTTKRKTKTKSKKKGKKKAKKRRTKRKTMPKETVKKSTIFDVKI